MIDFNLIIGIDPGKTGAIVYHYTGTQGVEAVKMPKDGHQFRDFLKRIIRPGDKPIVFIERVHIRPTDGKVSAAKFKSHYDNLIFVLETLDLPFVQIVPITWQKGLHIWKKGEEKKDRKNRFKEIAASRHPNLKVYLWSADALLIWELVGGN